MSAPKILTREAADIRSIDAGVKNKFKWSWLEEKDCNADFLSMYIRKLDAAGQAFCSICRETIKYGSGGKKDVIAHAKKIKHKRIRSDIKSNEELPACYQPKPLNENTAGSSGQQSVEVPYGAAPNISNVASQDLSRCLRPPNVPVMDRVAHLQAMTVSFIAENSLPLSLADNLIAFAKEFGRDDKASSSITLGRTSATYKLKEGLSKYIHKNVVSNMCSSYFSINTDQCTASNYEKILSILVSYYSEELNRCVVYHYASTAMKTANAETTGFETRLREKAPQLLDIDGDVCHHVHNSVKKYCSHFDKVTESLADDLHTDFKYSPDLREYLSELCQILNIPYVVPSQRIPHRWLSAFDVTIKNLELIPVLTLFYYAWVSRNDTDIYKEIIVDILRATPANARKRVYKIIRLLKAKNLTTDGLNRKHRIVKAIFFSRRATLIHMYLYSRVLPLFKSFVLVFESNEPKIHTLHDEQCDLMRHFLCCFVKHEEVHDRSPKELLALDCTEHFLPMENMYVGEEATTLLLQCDAHDRNKILSNIQTAYADAGAYLQKKLPLNNRLLRYLSALDPRALGHSESFAALKKLAAYFPTVICPDALDGIDAYKLEISKLQVDTDLPAFDGDVRLDAWWTEVFKTKRYPFVAKIVKAALSIFTAPRIEQSFSVMNDVIDRKANRMNADTYAAIQNVKYDLKAHQMTTVNYYHRPNVGTSAVNKSMIYHMHTSYGGYKKKLEGKRRKVVANIRRLGLESMVHPLPVLVRPKIDRKIGSVRRNRSTGNRKTIHELAKDAKKRIMKGK